MPEKKTRPTPTGKNNPGRKTSAMESGQGIATADVDPAFLKTLDERHRLTEAANIAAPDFTYRHNWGLRNGWLNLKLNGPFSARSNIFVSVSELSEAISTTDPTQYPIMGSARFSVYNVVPLDGAVQVRVFIDWPSPIFLQVSYLVIKP